MLPFLCIVLEGHRRPLGRFFFLSGKDKGQGQNGAQTASRGGNFA